MIIAKSNLALCASYEIIVKYTWNMCSFVVSNKNSTHALLMPIVFILDLNYWGGGGYAPPENFEI